MIDDETFDEENIMVMGLLWLFEASHSELREENVFKLFENKPRVSLGDDTFKLPK
jgi:hypothetical protein